MSTVVEQVELDLRACKDSFDEAKFDAAAQKLRFVYSKFDMLSKRAETPNEKATVGRLDQRMKMCENLVADVRRSQTASKGPSSGAVDAEMDSIVALLNAEPAKPVGPRPTISITPASSSSSSTPPPSQSPRAAASAVPRVNISPPASRSDGVSRSWSVEELARQLEAINVSAPSVALFRKEAIDGIAFASLTDDDLKQELKLPLGDRKKVQQLRDGK